MAFELTRPFEIADRISSRSAIGRQLPIHLAPSAYNAVSAPSIFGIVRISDVRHTGANAPRGVALTSENQQ